jgi:hypothetical protein
VFESDAWFRSGGIRLPYVTDATVTHDGGTATIVLPQEAALVLGDPEIESLESLRPRPLGATVGVWRVRGGGGSAIVKLLRLGASPNLNWRASENPAHPRWWRREPSVYAQGIPDLFEPELRAPRLLHVGERTDGSVALWLEDLGRPASWTVEAVADVARLLGAAQGRLSRDLPNGLPSGFLRAYLEPRLDHLAEPFAGNREAILLRLDQISQTICHFDLHPANVFPGRGGMAVIDWAYCGLGPIGADAGVLASDALADEIIKASEAAALVAAVWAAYSDGLADERLSEEAAEVYALGTALRYAWLPAWVNGEYGPEPSESRRLGAAAAHEAFLELAERWL